MTINKNEFEFENNRLDSTKKWIDNEINIINKSNLNLQNKISELRKQAKGRYNEELETTQKLYSITHKNLEKYTEAKDQPYFARIDFREKYRDNESYYIGKFGLGDSKTGDEIVIDWRSPIADLYYSGTQGETSYEIPDGFVDGILNLKRKFLIRNSKLKDAFDEGINEIILKSNGEDNALVDEFLKINLEESVSSKLKDVVATIQKEQNDIIRAGKNSPLIVQGSAGSGKTTIALHRLAYLLYKYSKTISGNNILVIAPNKLFLDYISMVLPSLGIDKVRQKTFEEQALEILQLKGKILTKDKKLIKLLEEEDEGSALMLEISRFKGSMLYKCIMDDYISYIEAKDAEIEDIKVDKYTLFSAEDIKRLFIKDMKHLPIDRRKDEIKRYFMIKFNNRISEIMEKVVFKYEYSIARIKKIMEDGSERRKKIIELYDERDASKKYILKSAKHNIEEYFERWKHKDTKELIYKLFNDENIFNNVAKNNIPKELAQYIRDELNYNLEKGIIDSDDLAAMIYLKFKIEGVEEKFRFKHIVIDEAQDYSLFQYCIIKDMAKNNSYTIVGDVGQGIYYYKGIDDWGKLIKDVFDNEGNYTQLTQSYRSTVEIIDFANKVLIKQENSLKPAKPVLRHGIKPEIRNFENNKDFTYKMDEIVKYCEEIGKNNIAIIAKTYEECKKIKGFLKKYSIYNWNIIKDTDKSVSLEKIIIPSYMTKGLEFDCSIIYNCDEKNYSNSELDKKILYVVLTRALHLEYIFYNKKLSPILGDI